MKVELVFVCAARTTLTAQFDSALDLAKETNSISKVKVGVQHVALQPIPIGVFLLLTPDWVVEVLIPLANLAAKRKRAICPKRDKLDGIEWIAVCGAILQVAIVFIVAKLFVSWRHHTRIVWYSFVLRRRSTEIRLILRSGSIELSNL